MRPVAVAAPASALLGVYRPAPPLFVAGEGTELVDAEGRRYLDFTSGLGVVALGHGAPEVRTALEEGLRTGLVHTSNLFRTGPAEELARRLVEASFPGRVFFCNSGAEANEAAFKFARRRAREVGGERKHGIVALRGSFHGRLFGSLAATDRPEYRAPFEPLVPGIRFAEPGDMGSVEAAVSREGTAAVIAEAVQGEGGVRPLDGGFLRELRALCRERSVALILDEVQCGLGRTGRLFAYEEAGIVPDLLTLAKPLAGGLPMGAVVVSEEVAGAIRPGDHATTFGGGPLVAGVARAVFDRIRDETFLASVRVKGAWLGSRLRALAARRPEVAEVRGRGLMWGVELGSGEAAGVVARALRRGLLLSTAGPRVVRLLPPLTVSAAELERGVEILEETIPSG